MSLFSVILAAASGGEPSDFFVGEEGFSAQTKISNCGSLARLGVEKHSSEGQRRWVKSRLGELESRQRNFEIHRKEFYSHLQRTGSDLVGEGETPSPKKNRDSHRCWSSLAEEETDSPSRKEARRWW